VSSSRVVSSGSAIVLSCESGDAGLDLEHPPLCVVHLGPGGGDPADDPTCEGSGRCAHGVLLLNSCFGNGHADTLAPDAHKHK
jgi:hypothetical protein